VKIIQLQTLYLDSVIMPVIVDTEELIPQQTTDEELQRKLESFSSNLKLQKFLLQNQQIWNKQYSLLWLFLD